MDTNEHSIYLSPAEVAAVIKQFKLYVSAQSPLHTFRGVSDKTDKNILSKKVPDSTAWRTAMQVLASPEHKVRATIAGPGGTLTSFYFGTGGSDILVGCWPRDDGLHVSFPWTPDRISSVSAMALTPASTNIKFADDITLTPAGLTALAAVIDAVKQSQLTAQLNRSNKTQEVFNAESIVDQAGAGLANNDTRWLMTLIRDLAPSMLPIRYADLEKGFDELINIGVIKITNGAWEPADWIRELVDRWHTPLPAAAHEVVTISDDEVTSTRHLMVFRGGGPLWMMEYEGITEGSPRVACRNVSLSEYLEALERLIPMVDVPETGTTGTRQEFCTRCGSTLEQGNEFCTDCGKPVSE